jgi:phosphate/sulfate permease
MLELIAILVGSTIAVGYACYVATEVVRADFYSRAQKIAQVVLVVVIPIIGAALVHWFLSLHRTPSETTDPRFIPQREPTWENAPSTRIHHDET